MPLPNINPTDARNLLEQGAVLIDIREADEHAREKIPGALNMPLSKLHEADLALHQGRPVIFHCKSGGRTTTNAQRLSQALSGACEAYVVEGGIDAWRRAGLPVATDRSQPIELQRQVQILVGSIAFIGVMLGLYAAPVYFVIPGFISAGLVFAGVTGLCPMARLLLLAPWNKRV